MKISVVGVCFLLLGSTFLFLSLQYPFGSLSKIGPGFFPSIISGILIVLSVVVWAADKQPAQSIDVRSIVVVFLSIISFISFVYFFNLIAGCLAMAVMYFCGFRNVK